MKKNTLSVVLRYFLSITLALLFYPMTTLGAQKHITVKGEAMTIKQAIQLIEKNSDYTFFYNAADLGSNTKHNFNSKGKIEDVLTEIFNGNGISYLIKGNEVILKVNKTESTQQTKKRTITGTVTASDNNEPVIGASVWLKNSSIGAITDIDGKYSITVEGIGGVLEISYMGYKKQEVAIADQKVINIVLSPDTEVLDEVVVVGYGSQKKESVVGAISTLDIKKLKVPGASISNVLAGQLSGVVAMSRSGEPGKSSSADFYIRGVSSFKGTSTPLVLVDGIERDLDLVDTDDIATFSILKDASASAVYGVRGANGVILITTKKGEVGKPAINVRTEFGFTSPTKRPEMTNSAQWAELYNEAFGRKYYSDEEIEKYTDFKQRLSTKMLGESLEQHCENEFNSLRMTAFPTAYFEKDSDISKGTKGGYIEHEGNLSQDGSCWIAMEAIVCDSAQVRDDAWVSGNAAICLHADISGHAKITGEALISDHAQVSGNAVVTGYAQVHGNATVREFARLEGNANVYGHADISGHAQISGHAEIFNMAKVHGNAKVYDNAGIMENVEVYDNAEVYGKARISKKDHKINGDTKIFAYDDELCR